MQFFGGDPELLVELAEESLGGGVGHEGKAEIGKAEINKSIGLNTSDVNVLDRDANTRPMHGKGKGRIT